MNNNNNSYNRPPVYPAMKSHYLPSPKSASNSNIPQYLQQNSNSSNNGQRGSFNLNHNNNELKDNNSTTNQLRSSFGIPGL